MEGDREKICPGFCPPHTIQHDILDVTPRPAQQQAHDPIINRETDPRDPRGNRNETATITPSWILEPGGHTCRIELELHGTGATVIQNVGNKE